MRIFASSRTAYTPRIRLVNLVDILFILLIFFVATTTFRMEMPAAVKLVLPEARTAEELGRQPTARLLLVIGPDETIYLDDQPVRLEQLEELLRRAKQQQPELLLQFFADKQVSYGLIVAVVDAARAAGINNITAFTRKSVQEPPAP
jgi:biopolymer transport protein ExbD